MVVVGLAVAATAAWIAIGQWPTVVVVERGDTLFLLAREHGVRVEQIREWNGIEGDLIEVGQRLWLWPAASDPPTAPAASAKPARRRSGRGSSGGAAGPVAADPAAPTFAMPPPKPCEAAPSDAGLGEAGMAASEGLSEAEARTALHSFAPNVLHCLRGTGASPRSALRLELTVACTGRVDRVRIDSRGDWPDDIATCVADTMRYAPFPAHGLPDGDVVLYPLTYTP